MNKELLLDAMHYVEDDLLEQSEQSTKGRAAYWKWGSLAACFALVLAAAVFFFGRTPENVQLHKPSGNTQMLQPTCSTPQQDQPEPLYGVRQWVPVYNRYEERVEMDLSRALEAGYFYEPVSPDQIGYILPDKQEYGKIQSARAGYFADGSADCVSLQLQAEDETVYVTVGNYFSCVIYPEEDITQTQCGEQIYKLYRFDLKNTTYLEADTKVNGVQIHFSMNVQDPETGTDVFENVLECFSWYGENAPDLDRIQPSRIPEFCKEELELKAAQEDPDFGKWFLQDVPAGYQKETMLRYKDYYSDCLYGFWTKGYDQLRWEVSKLTEEDKARITSVDATENYDLSLYPIPRADSVPEELREIVDDPIFRIEDLTLDIILCRYYEVYDRGEGGNSGRMQFSVLYEDVIVEVRTKGISPQWLYEQLMKLPG